jgi:polysaccharide deacetylase family protein (PEP-CTERM system associated)
MDAQPLPNALTFDLEDWYQGLTSTSRQIEHWPFYKSRIEFGTQRLLSILAEAGVRATFFVLGYLAENCPYLVRQVADAGHEIALHGYYHRRLDRLTPKEFQADTIRGLQAVEMASRSMVRGYRAAMFSINASNLWALEILQDLGFLYDSSFFPVRNPWYGYPSSPRFPFHPLKSDRFVEIPLSTARWMGMNWPVAGGFYLRLLPYSIFKAGLSSIQREGQPVVLYLHPWDLDPDQPRLDPTLRERVTHYHNLGSTEGKLLALLRDFHFEPVCKLLEHLASRL